MQSEDILLELKTARSKGPAKTLVIPPCPDLVVQLQAAMDCADPDLHAVARIASSDVAMSAVLLKMANSSLYARRERVITVEEAMATMGLNQTAAVLTGFMMRSALHVNSPLLEQFWDRSGRRALALAHIARQLYNLDPALAHTMGLFCHVGLPVMLKGMRGYAGTLAEAQARIDRSFIATENAAHRTDHAVVGALVARTWNMAESLQLAVRLHHDFEALQEQQLPLEVRTLVAATLVADRIVHSFDNPSPEIDWLTHGQDCMDFLSISEIEITAWTDNLHEIFASAVA